MKKTTITHITIITVVTVFLVFFGISQYSQKKRIKNDVYMTQSGAMIFGGMAKDKDKIESFKKDFEKDDVFNRFWNYLDLSVECEKKGDYTNAIIEREKALELAIKEMGKAPQAQARDGLRELYEKVGMYDNAIKQYDWLIAYQGEALKYYVGKKSKFAITQQEKLLQDLKSSRARVEELSGMAKDKDKIESFKKDFEKDDAFNRFWNYLDLSADYMKKGDYTNAIIQREEALEFAIKEMGEGAQWQVLPFTLSRPIII